MKIGILGTGGVGATLATKFVERGHDVKMGSRDAKNPKAHEWAKKAGPKASVGTFSDAAKFGELVFNCTKGDSSVDLVKKIAGELGDKVLVDVSNALDFSKGMPLTLFVDVAKESLAERIQLAAPKAKVVKSLNTLTQGLMTNPGALGGDSNVFLSGNDKAAKEKVAQVFERDFGWKKHTILDLGDLTSARAQEAMFLPWARLWGAFGHANFNWHVRVGPKP